MRQAIEVKYIGPSNTKGSRYKASCPARTIYRSVDNALNPDDNALAVAHELAKALDWSGKWYGGVIRDAIFVFVNDDGKGSNFKV